jgi:hypothetical protein
MGLEAVLDPVDRDVRPVIAAGARRDRLAARASVRVSEVEQSNQELIRRARSREWAVAGGAANFEGVFIGAGGRIDKDPVFDFRCGPEGDTRHYPEDRRGQQGDRRRAERRCPNRA